MHRGLYDMPIDRSIPAISATTAPDGSHEIEVRDRTLRLHVLIPPNSPCATATFERLPLEPQEIPAPRRDHTLPANRNRKPKKCGGCKAAAAANPPATVLLRGWRARLFRRAGRERVCAQCDTAIRWLGLEWCGKPRNAIKRLLGYATDGCGCILNVKRRIGWADCPAGKWRIE